MSLHDYERLLNVLKGWNCFTDITRCIEKKFTLGFQKGYEITSRSYFMSGVAARYDRAGKPYNAEMGLPRKHRRSAAQFSDT